MVGELLGGITRQRQAALDVSATRWAPESRGRAPEPGLRADLLALRHSGDLAHDRIGEPVDATSSRRIPLVESSNHLHDSRCDGGWPRQRSARSAERRGSESREHPLIGGSGRPTDAAHAGPAFRGVERRAPKPISIGRAELLGERAHLSLRHELAADEDADSIADLLYLVEQVAGEQNGRAIPGQLAHELEHFLDTRRIDRGRWFVKDHDRRLLDEDSSQAEALAHAARVRPNLVVRCVLQSDACQQTVMRPRLLSQAVESAGNAFLAPVIRVKANAVRQITDLALPATVVAADRAKDSAAPSDGRTGRAASGWSLSYRLRSAQAGRRPPRA